MAITGIDTIEGKQIIAAGAVSAKSAEMAYNDENGNPITGYLTAVPEGYATTEDLTSYQLTADMTGYQVAGDYYSASNPSGFITGVDLSDYATTAQLADKQDITGMTAYQPVGDYLTTGDSANFYTTANESGFITGVPDTYLQNTDLMISDGKITEISGVPLSAGDELPEAVSAATDYVTANSATINGTVETVSSNSGSWGGEALPLSSRDGIDLEISDDMLYIGASALTASINAKLDASVYSTDSGSFLTAVPTGTMNESAFEYDANNKISGYNGSAFAAGEMPDMSQYVPYSATELAIGDNNNVSPSNSFAQGSGNTAMSTSFAQGEINYAWRGSFAQGKNNTADYYSIAQGIANTAKQQSQAFGVCTKATATGMAIGRYNSTFDAAFVIGNGTVNSPLDTFIIYHDGSVSAAGKISANGIELGMGGSNYTAGTGIDITNNTISVDTTVIATVDMVSAVSSMIGDIESALANL